MTHDFLRVVKILRVLSFDYVQISLKARAQNVFTDWTGEVHLCLNLVWFVDRYLLLFLCSYILNIALSAGCLFLDLRRCLFAEALHRMLDSALVELLLLNFLAIKVKIKGLLSLIGG